MTITVHEKKTLYTPEQVGYLPEKIQEIDSHFMNLISTKRLVSAGYILSKEGKVFAHKSMGRLRYNVENKDLLPDSLRRIASMTKIFTAISIMQLVEKGKIHINQPVKTIIKEFDKHIINEVTIFHLLTHTSGISPTPGSLKEPYPADQSYITKKDWITEGLRGYLYAEPGQRWAYSSFGFMILSEIISRITGVKYEDYVYENIIKRLDLNNTFFYVPEGYEDRICISDKHSENLLIELKEEMRKNIDWNIPKGHSGIYSNLQDMHVIGQMFLNKGVINGVRILSRKTVEAMIRNQLTDNTVSYSFNDKGMTIKYGLGLRICPSDSLASPGTFGHEGTGLCGLFVDPVENFVMVYFSNLPIPIWIPEPVINLRNIVWSGII